MYRGLLRLVSHSAIYGLGSIAAKVIALLLLPLYTRYLEPTSYGIVEAVLMIDLFAAALFRLGLQNAMMRFFYDTDDEERERVGVRVVRTSFVLISISTIVGALVLVAFAEPLATFFLGDPGKAYFIWIGAFGMWTSVLYATITATFRLEQRPFAFLMISLGNVALSVVLTLYFVTELKLAARGLLLGNFLGFLGMVPIAAAMQWRYLVPIIDKTLVKPLLRFAIPTIPMAIAFQSLTLIDRTIISRQLGLAELGVYGVAAKFASIVLLVVTALQLSWQPFAYSIKDDEEARVTYAVVTSWFAAVMGWLVAGIALLAAPAVRWFTVPAYFGAAQLIPLLALASGIYGAYFLIGIGVSRVKRTGWHAAVAFGAVAVSFVANMVLVREIGVLGAAVSAVLANAALVTFMLVRAHKVFPVPYEITRLARAVGLTLIAVALAYVLPEGTDIWSVMWRVLIALSFPIILVGSGFLTEPERERIGRRLRRSRAAS